MDHMEGEMLLSFNVSAADNPCSTAHRVFGLPLLPTDAYLEMIYVAATTRLGFERVTLEDFVIASPLVGAGKPDERLALVLRREGAVVHFAVTSDSGSARRLHVKGALRGEQEAPAQARVTFAGEPRAQLLLKRDVYDSNSNVVIGPLYRTIDDLAVFSEHAVSRIALTPEGKRTWDDYLLNPSLVNGLLMTALSFAIRLSGKPDSVYVPAGAATIDILGELQPIPHTGVARLRSRAGDSMLFDLDLVNERDELALTMRGLRVNLLEPNHLGHTSRAVPAAAVLSSPREVSRAAPEAIAVIGFAGRFPNAKNTGELWTNLIAGAHAVEPVPRERWDNALHYDPDARAPNRTVSKWGAFVDDVEQFDAEFFGISPMEAEIMDPQQRLFLEVAYEALEHAGVRAKDLKNKACGVFVGASTSDYEELLAAAGQATTAQAFTGLSPAVLAARLSYFLDLNGPALTVDTACSSSLAAFCLACQSIAGGESDVAIVGGVHLMLTPKLHVKASKAGMLSKSGASRTFDAEADGIVLGECVAAIVLKPLARALEDGDPIRAVVRGFASNQDGRTNGITAPSPAAQERLQLDVYRRFGIDPRSISYVEAHGTGTKLGDPIEIDALTRAFRSATQDRQFCAVGSVKPNIGHTVFAAGVASVAKVLLAFEHEQIPPSINMTDPNPLIDFDNSPFYVARAAQPWPRTRGAPRLAAINSFGFSGTNCHVGSGGASAARGAKISRPRLLSRPYFCEDGRGAARAVACPRGLAPREPLPARRRLVHPAPAPEPFRQAPRVRCGHDRGAPTARGARARPDGRRCGMQVAGR